MIRTAGIGAVVTVVIASALHAIAGSGSQQAAVGPRFLAPGVSLFIDEIHVDPVRKTDALVEMRVTLSNDGPIPLKIDYLTFSLSGAGGERSLALLPAELYRQATSVPGLRVGVLAAGQRLLAVLYFRSLSSSSDPIDFRVDLVTADGRRSSRSFLPLALK